ncbi:unnamed protein product [Cladocopium goreaui]|uniref:Phenylalanine--tRNA ligase n=2 Tax=Cladocopium goreaui TaxID=2562237 RepID=A0A9P1D9T4_9DINO|nr:unnamed protein product [Cladocopium goreaui]
MQYDKSSLLAAWRFAGRPQQGAPNGPDASWQLAMHRLRAPQPASAASVCIGACCRAAAWEASMAVLHSIEEHRMYVDTVAFNGALTACSKKLHWKPAVNLLAAMKRGLVRANSISYISAFKSLKQQMDAWAHSSWSLQKVRSQGLRLHLFLRSACSTLCADVGAWEKATALTGEEDDVVAVNGVLSACARRLNWPQALRLYATMRQRGVKPSQKSLTALASAMSRTISNVAMDAPSSPCPWSHALSLASYVGLADLKGHRRHRLRCREFIAAVTTSCSRRWDIALQVASEFEGEVDAILLGATMHAVGLALAWSRVLAMFQRTTASPTTGLCNIAITACARSSQVGQGRKLLEICRAQGLEPDTQSFNALMGVVPEKQELGWPLAMQLVMQMDQCSLQSDRLTLNNALASSSHGRCWLQALWLLGARQLPAPGLVAYNVVMEASRQQPRLVLGFFREMHVQSLNPDVTTLCLVAEACGQLGRFGLSSSFLRAAEENVVAALQEKDGRFDILSNVDGVRKHVSENKNVKVRKR